MERGLQSVKSILDKYQSKWSRSQFVLLERIFGKKTITARELLMVKKISYLVRGEADKLQSQIFEKEINIKAALEKIDKIYIERSK